ncbi:MAG: FCD domain-containing protein, partial [Actinomycetia bacterium]|nr:FCD domain-containing protein [Actinomycetes bacterium]
RPPVRADDTQLRAVDALLQSMARASADGAEPLVTRLNMSFHVMIASAAGNRVLAETLQSIVELYEPQQRVIGRLYDDQQHDYDEHREIFAAIVDHDQDRATDLMHAHLQGVISVVTEKLQARRDSTSDANASPSRRKKS